MGVLAQVFSFPSITLAAAVESLYAIRHYPDTFPKLFESESHLGIAAVIFLANWAFLGLFWGLIYPRLLSPLRHLPGPRVSKPASERPIRISGMT
jgi:hypothetical protein